MSEYTWPVNQNLLRGDPTGGDIAQLGGDKPSTFWGNFGLSWSVTTAANGWGLETRIEDLYNDQIKLAKEAGFNLPQIFLRSYDTTTSWGRNIHAAATDFQDVISQQASLSGEDERYTTHTLAKTRLREAMREADEILFKAKQARPDLGIKSLAEIDQTVRDTVKREAQRANDPRRTLGSHVSGFIASVPAMYSPSNPYFLPEMMLLGAIPGPSSAARIVTQGIAQGGLSYLEQKAGQRGLERAGVPLSDRDIYLNTAIAAGTGFAFQGLAEMLMGRSGRAVMDDAFSFMSVSKRSAKWRKAQADAYGPLADKKSFGPAAVETPVAPSRVPLTPEEAAARPISESSLNFALRTDQQVRANILDAFSTTLSGRVRAAFDLDHIDPQLDLAGMAIGDLIPPSRALSATATIIPDIRVNKGSSLVDGLQPLPTATVGLRVGIAKTVARANMRYLAKTLPDEWNLDAIAREMDPETFGRWDKINASLRKAEQELVDATRFAEGAKAGSPETLAARVKALEDQARRAKTPETRAAREKEIAEAIDYAKRLEGTRLGEGAPPPSRAYDIPRLTQRVADIKADRDGIFADLERAIARAQGVWGLKVAEREALEQELRADANNWLNSPWRHDPGEVRSRKKGKTDVEKMLDKAEKELFAEPKKVDLPQLTDPLATKNPKAGETSAETATRVNDLKRKELDDGISDKWYTDAKAWIAEKFPAAGEKTAKVAAKTAEPIPGQPVFEPIPQRWAGLKAFEMEDGRVLNFRDAMDEIQGEHDSFKYFGQCAVLAGREAVD